MKAIEKETVLRFLKEMKWSGYLNGKGERVESTRSAADAPSIMD